MNTTSFPDEVNRIPPANSISQQTPGMSVHQPSPYDFDAEDRNKKKRLILFAVLAILLLLAFLVPLIVTLASKLTNGEQKEEGDLSDSVIVEENKSWRDNDSDDDLDDGGGDDADEVIYGCTISAVPDPETDFVTYTLPDCASTLSLALPASIEDIFFDDTTGITGFGVHSAEYPDGLDHVLIALKPGTPVKSWAQGDVVDLSRNGDFTDIRIDYGRNVVGIHIGIETVYVDEGDRVLQGQEIGIGRTLDSSATSAEFALLDRGRTDGVFVGRGSYVSPFDYLDENDKMTLVESYREQVLEPYRSGTLSSANTHFFPREPYLTNRLFLHNGNEGKIAGEWYLSQPWGEGEPADILAFVEAHNSFYSGNYMIASDYIRDDDEYVAIAEGSFVVDYEAGTVRISNWDGEPSYCLFELDDSQERAVLQVECQQSSYPTAFSANMLEYVERDAVPLLDDALALGVLDD